MNDEERKQAFLAQVRAALDEQTDNLDPSVESSLNQIRRKALEEAEKKGYIGKPSYRWSTLGAAATAAAVLLVALITGTPTTNAPVNGAIEDMEIMTLADQYELVENVDFFTWLAEQGPDAG